MAFKYPSAAEAAKAAASSTENDTKGAGAAPATFKDFLSFLDSQFKAKLSAYGKEVVAFVQDHNHQLMTAAITDEKQLLQQLASNSDKAVAGKLEGRIAEVAAFKQLFATRQTTPIDLTNVPELIEQQQNLHYQGRSLQREVIYYPGGAFRTEFPNTALRQLEPDVNKLLNARLAPVLAIDAKDIARFNAFLPILNQAIALLKLQLTNDTFQNDDLLVFSLLGTQTPVHYWGGFEDALNAAFKLYGQMLPLQANTKAPTTLSQQPLALCILLERHAFNWMKTYNAGMHDALVSQTMPKYDYASPFACVELQGVTLVATDDPKSTLLAMYDPTNPGCARGSRALARSEGVVALLAHLTPKVTAAAESAIATAAAFAAAADTVVHTAAAAAGAAPASSTSTVTTDLKAQSTTDKAVGDASTQPASIKAVIGQTMMGAHAGAANPAAANAAASKANPEKDITDTELNEQLVLPAAPSMSK